MLVFHLPASGNSRLQAPRKPACVPACPCGTGLVNVVPPLLEEGLCQNSGLKALGRVKLLLGFAFLLLWCCLVNWGSTEPAPAGFPGKIDTKTVHVGFSPCLACAASCQHGGGSPGGLAASTGERVSIGSHLLWILPSAVVWLGNK